MNGTVIISLVQLKTFENFEKFSPCSLFRTCPLIPSPFKLSFFEVLLNFLNILTDGSFSLVFYWYFCVFSMEILNRNFHKNEIVLIGHTLKIILIWLKGISSLLKEKGMIQGEQKRLKYHKNHLSIEHYQNFYVTCVRIVIRAATYTLKIS